ncbi:YqjK-like family protein [Edwardsiella tarda]|uniref:YqjK family protein n=1 Tax=Edwardsiella tarda TaxID=636 RepID=UPI00351C154E
MNRHRQALADEKALLLQQIALQRLDLHREVMHTEQLCQRIDRSLGVLWRLRRPLSLVGGVIAVYAARRPSRLMRGVRRVVALWSTLRLARRSFYP